MKILCLHGHMQSASSFRGRLGFMRKGALAKCAELVFVDGPHQVPAACIDEEEADGLADGAGGSRLTWFKFDAGWRETGAGFEETVATLEEVAKREGPFDGLLGFSLGAVVASVVASPAVQERHPLLRVRFVILCSGFRSPAHAELYAAPNAMPSLHLWGTADRHVAWRRSEELSAAFADPVVEVSEGGGHVIPSQKKEAIARFVQRFAER
eukprot:tig00000718_g3696.t1